MYFDETFNSPILFLPAPTRTERPMDPRVKALWLDTLRSDEYRQERGCLHKEGGYCCLGVLSDLYRRETGDGSWNYGLGFDGQVTNSIGVPFVCAGDNKRTDRDDWWDGETGVLHDKVMKWAGLEACDPQVNARFEDGVVARVRLSLLNDGFKATSPTRGMGGLSQRTFKEIADFIEKQL